MGLAIDGKVYADTDITYIGNNPIYYGYINEDGSHKLMNTDKLDLNNFVTKGNYLTNLKKLQSFIAFDGFMNGYYDDPEHVPVLIHVPDDIIRILMPMEYNVFAFFCFLIKYGKTDYSKDPDKKKKMDKAFSIIYNMLKGYKEEYFDDVMIIQPPVDELNNFTFACSALAQVNPLPVDEFFAKYSDSFNNVNIPVAVDKIFYKGKQVDFYEFSARPSWYNSRVEVYFGSGYGVAIHSSNISGIDTNFMKVAYMKYTGSEGVVAKYYYTCFDIRVTNVTDNGSSNTVSAGGFNFHNYDIPTYNTPKASNGDYDIYSLAFNESVGSPSDLRSISFDLDHIGGIDSHALTIATTVPYNPDIFLALDINNRYNWFYSGASNMLTLPKKIRFDGIGGIIDYPETPLQTSGADDGHVAVPLGRYLINSSSTSADIPDAPVSPSYIAFVEARFVGNKTLEQIVYTKDLHEWIIRAYITDSGFTWYGSKWRLV